MVEPIGVAVIGAGLVGPTHAEFAARADGAALRVVCDVREDRGRPRAERFGADWATDYRAAVARPEISRASGLPAMPEKSNVSGWPVSSS